MSAKPTFLRAAMAHFGLRPGQTLGAFAEELDRMSYAERRDLAAGMRAAGLEFADPI